eukprot:154429_1
MANSYSNKLFIFGYLRQYETNTELFSVVPITLYELVYSYYPKKYNIYAIGKNDFNEFGLQHTDPITKCTKLNLFSNIICHPMDIINSYRTYIIRDYNNGLSYFGHIQESPSFINHFKLQQSNYNLNKDITKDIKIISQGIMAKVSIIATQDILTIYLHDKENTKPPKQYINYMGSIFKTKIIKICCLMHEAIYLCANGQIYYALHNSSTGLPNMINNNNDINDISKPPQHIPVISDCDNNNMKTNVFISDIACGSWHTLLLSNNGNIYGFGKNMFGQLGFGDKTEYMLINKPMLHPFLDTNLKFIKICCGALFSMFIAENGLCFLSGDNDEGQIGNGNRKIDVKLPYILDTNDVGYIVNGDCGNKHSVILNTDNKIFCFGENVYKQCVPYYNDKWFDIPKELIKPRIGIQEHHVVERVVTGVDSTILIVCY